MTATPATAAITSLAALQDLQIWIVFALVPQPDGKKPKKVPYTPGTNQRARVNDPSTWCTHAKAVADAERTGRIPGFALTPEMNLTLVDIDGRIDKQLIAELDSCTELSRNGGTHIFVRGRPPAGFVAPPGVEVYPRDGNRFVLPTYRYIDRRYRIEDRTDVLARLFPPRPEAGQGGPIAPAEGEPDDAEAVRRVRLMPKGRQLFDAGDITGYESPSEADLALLNCFIAAGITTPDRLVGLYGEAALDNPHWKDADYRARTIATALNGQVQPWDGWWQPAHIVRSGRSTETSTREEHRPVAAATATDSPGTATNPCAGRIAELERELATERERRIAAEHRAEVAEASVSALVQTFLNANLTHNEKIAAVALANEAAAKRARGEVEPDGSVTISPGDIANDHRPKPAPGEHIAPVNPKDGSLPRMPRSSARAVLDTAIERKLVRAEKRRATRTRANQSTYEDWDYVVSPAASLADMLNPWARYRPAQPKQRKVREARTCPHCGEAHPIRRQDICTGCGAVVAETIIQPEPTDIGEIFSPIDTAPSTVVVNPTRRKTFSHADAASDPVSFDRERRERRQDQAERRERAMADLAARDTARISDAPDPPDSQNVTSPQRTLFAMPDPPRPSAHFDVGD